MVTARRRRLSAALAAGLAALAAGCADEGDAPAPGLRAGLDGATLPGIATTGLDPAPCRLVSAPVAGTGASAVHEVRCGAWEAPAATIRTVHAASAGSLAADPLWRRRLATIADCAPTDAQTQVRGMDALGLACTVTPGRWPYQAFALARCGAGFQVEAVPAALPAALEALDLLCAVSGDTPAGTGDEDVKTLAARFGSAAYGPDDVARFNDGVRLAQFYNFSGAYGRARRLYGELLELQERTIAERPDLAGPAHYGGLAFLYMHIALEDSNLGAFVRADARFAQAEDRMGEESALAQSERARLRSYRALHHGNLGESERALAEARAATEIRRRLAAAAEAHAALGGAGAEADFGVGVAEAAGLPAFDSGVAAARGDLAQSLVIEATLLAAGRDAEGARGALAEARATLEAEPGAPRHWDPEALLVEARLIEREGDIAAALTRVERAIDAQRRLYDVSPGEAAAQFRRARLLDRLGRTDEARAAFRGGAALYAASDAPLTPDQALPFLAFTQRLIDVGAADAEKLRAEAFDLAQRARGPVVAAAADRTAARFAAGDPAASGALAELERLRRQEQLLDDTLAALRADPNALAFTIDEMTGRRDAARAAAQTAARVALAAAPGYEQLAESPVSLAEVRASLRPTEAFVQIVLGETGAFAFVITSESAMSYAPDMDAQRAASAIRTLLEPLRAGREATPDSRWIAASAELHDALLGPAAELLAGKARVAVAPSGPLLGLPFAILLERAPGAGEAVADWPWLARRITLASAASPASFANLRSRARGSAGRTAFAGFGDFIPSRDPDALIAALEMPPLACRSQAAQLATLPRLPGTAAEVRAIAARFGVRPVLGEAFNERQLLGSAAVRDARILYLATHGVLPAQFDCLPEPALSVSLPPGSPAGDDGLLTAAEAANLPIDADLVVLSACDTGGAGAGGEALSGLARAFFAAGARAVLASHWPVFDESTASLMTATFEAYAANGGDAAAALRAAQLRLMGQPRFAHPAHWGPFALIGG